MGVDIATLGFAVDTRKLKDADRDLRQLETQSARTERGANGLVASFGKLSAVMGALGIAVVIREFVQLERIVISLGSNFEFQMSRVGAVMRATQQEMMALTDVARQLGATTEYTASQAAGALTFLGMAGFQANQAIAVLPATLDLATAASTDLARSADIVSNVMTAMGLATTELSGAGDVLVATMTRSNTDMEMLAESFKYAAPLAHALGYSVEDLAALIGKLGDAGIQGSMAGTQLSFAMQRVDKVFKELGQNGSGKNLYDALEAIRDAGWDAAQIMDVFGERGGRAVLALVGRTGDLRKFREELSNVDGEMKRVATTMRDNLQGDTKNLASALEELALQAYETQKSGLRDLTQSLTNLVRAFGESGTTAKFGEDIGSAFTNIARGINALASVVDKFPYDTIKKVIETIWALHPANASMQIVEGWVALGKALAGIGEEASGAIDPLGAIRAQIVAMNEGMETGAIDAEALAGAVEGIVKSIRGGSSGGGGGIPKATKEIENLRKEYADTVKELERAIKLQGLSDSEKAAMELAFAIEDANDKFAELGKQAPAHMEMLLRTLNAVKNSTQNLDDEIAGAMIAFEESFGTGEQAARDYDNYMKSPERSAWLKEYQHRNDETTEAMNKAWLDLAQNIQQSMADVFYDILDGNKNLMDGLLSAFKRMLAEMIATAATNKVIIPIFQQVGVSPAGGNNFGGINTGSLFNFSEGSPLGFLNTPMWGAGDGSYVDQAPTAEAAGVGPSWAEGILGYGAAAYTAFSNLLDVLDNPTGESWGGLAGSVSLGAVGGFFGGPLGAALGATIGDWIGSAIGGLFDDNEFRMKTYAAIPKSFQEFQALSPEQLFGTVDVGYSPGSVSSEQRAQIDEVLAGIAGSTQTFLDTLYSAMPDTIKQAWDDATWEATSALETFSSYEGEDLKTIIGYSIRDWLDRINNTVLSSLVDATAQGFGQIVDANAPEIEALSQKWQGMIGDVFKSLFEGLTDPDEIAQATTDYQTFIATLLGGVAGISNYTLGNPGQTARDNFGITQSQQLANAFSKVDAQINFLTESLNDLDAQEYANALNNIATLTQQRYEMEVEYVSQLLALQKQISDSLNSQSQGFLWDTLDQQGQFDYASQQRQQSWNDAQRAVRSGDWEAFSQAVTDFQNWSQQTWQLGGQINGQEWQQANLSAFQDPNTWLSDQSEGVFDRSILDITDAHDSVAEKINNALIPAIDSLTTGGGRRGSGALPEMEGAVNEATGAVEYFGRRLTAIADGLAEIYGVPVDTDTSLQG